MGTVLNKEVINKENTLILAKRIKVNFPDFDIYGFHKEIIDALPSQTMGERIQQVRKSLYNFLPQNYEESVSILINSLPLKLKVDSLDKLDLASQNGFIIISLTSYISKYGMNNFNTSMKALKEMTKCFSSEGSIRYFIDKYPDQCNKLFDKWVLDNSPHVRRLVCEGLRPRLPMAISLQKYKKDPTAILKYLEILKDDPHLFIRRSVANNLNDISKDNPKVVTDLLKKWNNDKSAHRQWLIKHALRTLEKKGDPLALEILGFQPSPDILISSFKVKKKTIVVGENLEFSFRIESSNSQALLIDYIIYYMKSNGKQIPKVFKLKKLKSCINLDEKIIKSHSFKIINTRNYYSGTHYIALQINGEIYEKIKFNLID